MQATGSSNSFNTDLFPTSPKIKIARSEEPEETTTSITTITGPALKECAKLTKGGFSILHPKYSIFLQGVSMLCEGSHGDYDFSGGIGMLMVMASPVAELLRIGLGSAGTIFGAIGTAATGIAYGVERAARYVFSSSPPKSESMQEKLTRAYIQKMLAVLYDSDKVSLRQQQYFFNDPVQIISIIAITTAFMSRKLEKGKIMTSSQGIVSREDVKNLDKEHQGYFKDLCIIKNAISGLNYGANDDHSWNLLMKAIEGLNNPDELSKKYSEFEIERFQMIVNTALEFSEKIVEKDELFKKIWEEEVENYLY